MISMTENEGQPVPASAQIESELLPAVQALITVCITGQPSQQRAAANVVHNIFETRPQIDPLLEYFTSKPGSKSRLILSDSVKGYLKALEVNDDDMTTIILCQVAEVVLGDERDAKMTMKRRRRFTKADAASSLIRCLRGRLKKFEGDKLFLVATDALAAVLLLFAEFDNRLALKVRVGGLIQPLCQVLVEQNGRVLSTTLLKLLCRIVRSPRNAQICGRHKDFPTRLVLAISRCSEANDVQLLLPLTRLFEILYFVIKNRRTKAQLVSDNLTDRLVHLLEHHFEQREKISAADSPTAEYSRPLHTEICLVVVTILRVLANNKRVKNELITAGVVQLCERMMGKLSLEDHSSSVQQLQDSLCALCLRCLPTTQFPLAGVSFPLSVVLRAPASSSTTTTKRRSTSRSPLKIRPAVSNGSNSSSSVASTSTALNQSEDAQLSSDDDGLDEEDEVFGDVDATMRSEGDELEQDEPGSSTVNKEPPISFGKLRSTELASFDRFCVEFQNGAHPTPCTSSGPTHEFAIQEQTMATSSVVKFVKIGYPEYANPDVDQCKQPLSLNKDSMKEMVVQQMARAKMRAPFNSRVVYDLDALYAGCGATESTVPSEKLTCDDATRVGSFDSSTGHLNFESRFESGNLRRATQIDSHHYELILSPDINQVREHYQWFYFEVSNVEANVPYTFEIVNCLKPTSMYSRGMQPVMYSVHEAVLGRGGWVRAGDGVCYYRNLYTCQEEGEKDADQDKLKKKYFFSIRFNVVFRHQGDVCYFAYHYPYTYSFMKVHLANIFRQIAPSRFARVDSIGTSPGGNSIDMVTVTSPGTPRQLQEREVVFLSSRVHPGESNSSWIMHGILKSLLCDTSSSIENLLERFVIKVVPMLNPDGVINGSHRCSLAGVDLNRVWSKPSASFHPEIYVSKGVMQYMSDVLRKPPWIFVDLHGHSRRSNVFVFGNNPEESYRSTDKELRHDYEFMSLPSALEKISPAFSMKNSRFNIARSKESSARVVVWRQFGVSRSYTMESTYCGFETGSYRGYQVGTCELKEMGTQLLSAILNAKLEIRRSPQPKITKKASPISKREKSDRSLRAVRTVAE